jgi:hypothetical protein
MVELGSARFCPVRPEATAERAAMGDLWATAVLVEMAATEPLGPTASLGLFRVNQAQMAKPEVLADLAEPAATAERFPATAVPEAMRALAARVVPVAMGPRVPTASVLARRVVMAAQGAMARMAVPVDSAAWAVRHWVPGRPARMARMVLAEPVAMPVTAARVEMEPMARAGLLFRPRIAPEEMVATAAALVLKARVEAER